MADLYIRSQDKEMLVKCNCVEIMWKKDTSITDIYVNANYPDYVVGTYNSKERALEVLDEIQYKLLDSHIIIIKSDVPIEDVPIEMDKFKEDFDKYGIAQLPSCSYLETKNREVILFEMPEK